MNGLTIVKLGGSVITDKSRPGVIREENLAALAAVLAAADTPLIIVHGAGSLGHPEAKAYGIADGVTRTNARGVYETHAAVSRLNEAVVSALRNAGVEAVSLHPFACSLTEHGRLVFCGEEQIRCLAAAGIVPVLHGDVAMDTKKGGCIISGDQIVPYLAEVLGISRVGIVTETGGVLGNGVIVPEISRKNAASFDLGAAETTDVTGGMRGKIEEMLLLADKGIVSAIFAPEYLSGFLAGKPVRGTLVKP
ncbi:MAG: isopentenyl phosphate kinase [Methanocorpusculum sp.]|nr:isopentenyl phosphate kinase [Methanocorpusculum sp.]